TGSQRRILTVVDHRQPQRTAIIHHLTKKARGGDGLAIVADGDCAGLLHRSDVSKVLAFAFFRRSAYGPDAHGRYGSGAFHDGAGDGGVVIHGLRSEEHTSELQSLAY